MKNILGLLVCFFVGSVNASLIDLADVGSDGFFKDTSTSYTWMDVDNFLNMSYFEVEDALVGTGFHLATLDEMLTMQASTVGVDFSTLSSIMGSAFWSPEIIWGWYDDGVDAVYEQDSWLWSTTTWEYDEFLDPTIRFAALGAFAVKTADVPEPASIALFALGLVGLGFSRKKKAA